MERLIFHIDVNSAFLSWESARRVSQGLPDLREIPSCVGGDPKKRTGIVVAKSIPAKKYGIQTGEPVAMALRKCPNLVIVPSDFELYDKCSRAFKAICASFAPVMESFSIDEVFLDVTQYLKTYGMTARELASRIATEILEKKGLTATAGIGTNLYLCKIAMDIVAKHMEPDDNGVRIAELDEISYRELLWDHRPLTDFWRVGVGYRKKLEAAGMFTMGDVARCSIGGPGDYYNEDLLYRMFGINAELLIDHAWGYEPVTMDLIKSYRPETNCISSGQVLHCATDFMQAKIVVREMAEQLAMDLVEKKLVTDQIVLTVGYDIDNLKIPEIADHYHGEITVDRYGRSVPKHAHGTGNLDAMTASVSRITETTMGLYERIVDPMLLTRRITLVANHLKDADSVKEETFYEQLDLFSGGFLQTGQKETSRETKQLEKERLEKEKHLQEAMLNVKSKYGKNAILKAADLQEGATTIDRNRQIGGHKA